MEDRNVRVHMACIIRVKIDVEIQNKNTMDKLFSSYCNEKKRFLLDCDAIPRPVCFTLGFTSGTNK